MLPLALLLASAPQVTNIPLEVAVEEDDLPLLFTSDFTPDGATCLIPHFGGSVVSFDIATSTPASSVRVDRDVRRIAVSPDGSRAVYERPFRTITIHDVPSLAEVAAPLELASGTIDDFVMDRSGTRFLSVARSGEVDVFDLATGARERTFQSPEAVAEYGLMTRGVASDDRTFVTVGRRRLRVFDITTGQETGFFVLGTNRRAQQLYVNPAGTRAYVLVEDTSTGTSRVDVDVFAVPSLQRLGSIRTSIVGEDLWALVNFAVDEGGRRAVVADQVGLFTIDLTNGATRTLSDSVVLHAALSADGTTVAAWIDGALVLFDAGTGNPIGSRVGESGDVQGDAILAHPRLTRFFTEGGQDRIEIAERLPSGQVRFDDVNSGVSPERDGARRPLELADARRVAVPHQGTDEVVLVDVESEQVIASIPVERAPIAIAEVSGGQLAVVHGRGASVVVVDPGTLSVVDRVDLAGRAVLVEPDPGTNGIWVEVSEPGLRALQLVTTQPAAITATIPLPPPVPDPTNFQPDVVIDPVADLATVVEAGNGVLTVVRLSTGAIVGADTFTPGRAAQALVDPAGARVTVVSSRAEVRSWTVGPGGLAPDWTYTCTPDPVDSESSAPAVLWPDGSRLVAQMPSTFTPPPPGTCPRVVTLDTATGNVVNTAIANAWVLAEPLDGGVELIAPFSSRLVQYRFATNELVSIDGPFGSIPGFFPGFNRGAVSARTYGLSRLTGSSVGFVTSLAVIDQLADRRTTTCDPAVPNATGAPATLEVEGGGLVGGRLAARVGGLQPGSMFGYLAVADTLTAPMPVAGSQGFLCLGGSTGRFVDQLQPANAAGEQRYEIDLNAIPLSFGTVAAAPGNRWAFQSWYRDQGPMGQATSNFSPAVSVEIR